jgi:hypothetical protein
MEWWSGGVVEWWRWSLVRDCIARSRGCRERLDLLIGYWLLAIGYSRTLLDSVF